MIDSLSILGVTYIALTSHVSGNLLKRVHTPPVCILWCPEASITHNGGIFKPWLHILPSVLSYLTGPPPNLLGACTPIYVNPLYIPQLHLEACRLLAQLLRGWADTAQSEEPRNWEVIQCCYIFNNTCSFLTMLTFIHKTRKKDG